MMTANLSLGEEFPRETPQTVRELADAFAVAPKCPELDSNQRPIP